jgi:Pyruvate/2-oxoacid:ferredoxin oxidoreductase delta subunit
MSHEGHHHGSNHGHSNSEAYCVCPICNKALNHVPGVPCNSRRCPSCQHTLFKSYDTSYAESVIAIDEEDKEDHKYQFKKQSRYPEVVAEICTACGVCFNICPADAIVYRNDKAFIVESKCRNCKICVSSCSFNAINL